ncbi:hypothetical protein HAV15_012141 [Penicillium sp. str. |nr:hypothetical protein HAV15_012141 [Penicillium sp. str. \
MRLTRLIFTLVASSSMIMAAPIQQDGPSECQKGTSCVGEGGGDGALCGGADTWWQPQICPVKV